ncbi:MAG: phosphohydrolase, partial [Aquaticitalea sp.]
MKELINKWYRNHSLIYKVLLFISTTFLIVYLFPKSGKFKYNFDKGKPWQSENLYAPFDFAIKKSDEELKKEKVEIAKNSGIYFTLDSQIKKDVFNNYDLKFKTVFQDVEENKTKLYTAGKAILNSIYEFGLIEENYNYPPEKKVVLLEEQKQKDIINYDQLVKMDQLRINLEKAIDDKGYTQYKTIFLSLFFDVINPNVKLNKSLTDNSLKEDMDNISPTRGSIENETLIISKGELVEGNKFD